MLREGAPLPSEGAGAKIEELGQPRTCRPDRGTIPTKNENPESHTTQHAGKVEVKRTGGAGGTGEKVCGGDVGDRADPRRWESTRGQRPHERKFFRRRQARGAQPASSDAVLGVAALGHCCTKRDAPGAVEFGHHGVAAWDLGREGVGLFAHADRVAQRGNVPAGQQDAQRKEVASGTSSNRDCTKCGKYETISNTKNTQNTNGP